PEILNILKNDVVLISLYVDDKKELPEDMKVEYASRPGKFMKDFGDTWSDLQASRYKANSQPFYVIMDHKENTLIEPVGYTPDVAEYKTWLNEGISKFK
ncbi:thiol:disulfide interchange protein, partial [Formosa sp. S-31]